ncbi:MAG: hypothetical protein F9K19_04210 [Rhizobiaceae bacterium]|nr:MAG: hypothetical protein F9K19_04210 [Rhizobiaceae bacterium]CAG0987277.1 hypothetical protein RHIZO_02056 [Rhizobiaceae bacterium]
MSGKESLSLDEFATAPRRQRSPATPAPDRAPDESLAAPQSAPAPAATEETAKGPVSGEASKALRQMKRERMKGASHFVNVNLDRETKRRLKLASFNMETSMQHLMEKAIRQYLDANGF